MFHIVSPYYNHNILLMLTSPGNTWEYLGAVPLRRLKALWPTCRALATTRWPHRGKLRGVPLSVDSQGKQMGVSINGSTPIAGWLISWKILLKWFVNDGIDVPFWGIFFSHHHVGIDIRYPLFSWVMFTWDIYQPLIVPKGNLRWLWGQWKYLASTCFNHAKWWTDVDWTGKIWDRYWKVCIGFDDSIFFFFMNMIRTPNLTWKADEK